MIDSHRNLAPGSQQGCILEAFLASIKPDHSVIACIHFPDPSFGTLDDKPSMSKSWHLSLQNAPAGLHGPTDCIGRAGISIEDFLTLDFEALTCFLSHAECAGWLQAEHGPAERMRALWWPVTWSPCGGRRSHDHAVDAADADPLGRRSSPPDRPPVCRPHCHPAVPAALCCLPPGGGCHCQHHRCAPASEDNMPADQSCVVHVYRGLAVAGDLCSTSNSNRPSCSSHVCAKAVSGS